MLWVLNRSASLTCSQWVCTTYGLLEKYGNQPNVSFCPLCGTWTGRLFGWPRSSSSSLHQLISTCVTNSQCRLVNMSSFVVTGREVLLQYRRFLARIVSISDWFLHQCLNFALSSYFVLESSCNACITLSYMSWMMTRGFFSWTEQ